MKKIYLENYIKAYERHFKVDYNKRSDLTFKRVEDAGCLLDRYFPEEFKEATAYITAYKKCKELLKLAQ